MNDNKNGSAEYVMEFMDEQKEIDKKAWRDYQLRCLEKNGQTQSVQDTRSWEEKCYVDYDHPNTMDNRTATFWYIAVMISSCAFKFALFVWIIATIVYVRHINRRKIRQKKWDQMHKTGGNK